MWASGCHLRGCCIGVPSSRCVCWVPVLAFRHSSSITSRSPIRWSSPCSHYSVLVIHPLRGLCSAPSSCSIPSRNPWPCPTGPIIPVPAAPCFHPTSSCLWRQLGCCCAGSHHHQSSSPPLTIVITSPCCHLHPLLAAGVHNPPHEQWLAGLGVGVRLSIVCCLLFVPVVFFL